jgi:hypothetical protein
MTFYEAREDWERRYWSRVLKSCGNNISLAAMQAGCYRQNVYTILARLGLHTPRQRAGGWGNSAWRSLGGPQ